MAEGIGAAKRRAEKAEAATDIEVPVVPTVEEVKASLVALPGQENDEKGGPQGDIPAKHPFQLKYTDPRGHLWEGEFDTHILSIEERGQVGILRARLSGGVAPAFLDDYTANLLEMRAMLAISVLEGPAWLKKLGDFRDTGLLQAVYQEVAAHERRFWSDGAEGQSESTGA